MTATLHQPQVTQFINRYQSLLEQINNAFFSVNIVARKPEKNRPEGVIEFTDWQKVEDFGLQIAKMP